MIFSFLVCDAVLASTDSHSTGNEITGSAETEGHSTDRSADLRDLLYRFINFALLVIILAVVIKKTSIKDFFKTRSEEIRRKLEDLQKEKEEAEIKYQEMERQLKDFESKKQEIIDQFKTEGLAEKEKIIAEAEARVEQILEQSEITINQEIQTARDRLKKEVVDIAAQKAQEIISNKINEKDQDQLVDEFIERVGKVH
jgi:F-type H+-transporting ATPase subunit b